jgi:hypothetical protein
MKVYKNKHMIDYLESKMDADEFEKFKKLI